MAVTLSNDSKVTLGVAGSLGLLAVSATWWVALQLSDIDMRLDAMERNVGERFTLAAASEAALREAIENPGHRVPDPRDPNNIIEVKPTTR
jgi:hypothetical protein